MGHVIITKIIGFQCLMSACQNVALNNSRVDMCALQIFIIIIIIMEDYVSYSVQNNWDKFCSRSLAPKRLHSFSVKHIC